MASGDAGPTLAAVFSLAPVAAINCETSCFWILDRGGIVQVNPDRLSGPTRRYNVCLLFLLCSKIGPTVSAQGARVVIREAGDGKKEKGRYRVQMVRRSTTQIRSREAQKGWYVAKRCGFQRRRRRRGLGGETRDLGLGAQEVTSRPLRCDTHSINGIGLWWGLSTLKSDVPRWGPGGKRTGVLIARVPFSKAVMLHLNF